MEGYFIYFFYMAGFLYCYLKLEAFLIFALKGDMSSQ